MKKIYSILLMAFVATTFLSAKTLYCQMPYDWWWAGDGQGHTAAISLYAYSDNGSNGDWPGQLMTEVDSVHHVWSIDIALEGYTNIIFARSSNENAGWGAQTASLPVSEIGDNNLYIITSADPTWGDNPGCAGRWGVYDQDEPVEPTYITYHINVTNSTGWENFYLYAWGTPNEPFGGWPGAQGSAFEFQLPEGSTQVDLHLIFHNNVGEGAEGDQRQLLDITEARDYNLVVTATGVSEGTTAIDQIAGGNGEWTNGEWTKVIRNGQLFILRDGERFNLLGTRVQ